MSGCGVASRAARWAVVVMLTIAVVVLGEASGSQSAGGGAARAQPRDRQDLSLAPVSPRPGVTARDYLRGFTDEELAAARKAFPEREDPPHGAPIPRQVKVIGHVFVDANRNGKADDGEPRLPDVMVSDGERVTRTGRDGAFSFSFPIVAETHHRFVFANRPTGYASTNSFFVRIPFDEPATEYVAAFGFVEDAKSRRDSFSFVTTSDTQFSELEWMIPTAKDYAQMTGGPEPPAFLVTAGDLTDGGSHYHWDMYDFIRGASKVPVYDGFGGHDGSLPGNNDTTVNYEARIGPAHYSFDYGGVHFVHLVTELNYLQPEAKKRQEAWLVADFKALRPKTPVIAISHYPLPGEWFDQRKAEGIRMIGQISGHFHTVMAGSRNGVPVMSSAPANRPDWAAYGRPYRRVFVSPQGVTSERPDRGTVSAVGGTGARPVRGAGRAAAGRARLRLGGPRHKSHGSHDRAERCHAHHRSDAPGWLVVARSIRSRGPGTMARRVTGDRHDGQGVAENAGDHRREDATGGGGAHG